jgi:calcium-dependent protein kinase
MAHLLLTGRYPFTDGDNRFIPKIQKVFESILNAPIEQDSSTYKRLTPCAKDFVLRMLEKNVEARMGVVEALEHPFLRKL